MGKSHGNGERDKMTNMEEPTTPAATDPEEAPASKGPKPAKDPTLTAHERRYGIRAGTHGDVVPDLSEDWDIEADKLDEPLIDRDEIYVH